MASRREQEGHLWGRQRDRWSGVAAVFVVGGPRAGARVGLVGGSRVVVVVVVALVAADLSGVAGPEEGGDDRMMFSTCEHCLYVM